MKDFTDNEIETTLAPPQSETMLLEAASVEAATAQAAELWKVSADDIETVVIESGKRLFGLLGKKLKVQVSTKAPMMYLQARDFAGSIMKQSSLDLDVSVDAERTINIDGEDSAIVIGRHGETLKALEFLTNLIYRPDQNMPKIRLDCGGYRVRREESLIRLAESVAREVLHKHTPISLEPMSSWERRIIHMALQSNPGINTSSEGEEPLRKIVVYPSARAEKRGRTFRKKRY
ncbi:MAG: KH domain-containing protein [Synergistaceae bacterium]|jgi:spoIIIJ-associated protein|nr:KH domain-containing protein [Synergistaceae bacterium]